MAQFNHSTNNFKNGEIDGKALGDISNELYYESCELLENALPLKTGGVSRREGTVNVQHLKNTGNFGNCLIEFKIDRKEAYYIVVKAGGDANPFDYNGFSDEYDIHIYKNSGKNCEVHKSFFSFGMPFGYNAIEGGVLDPRGLRYVSQGDVLFLVHNSGKMKPFKIVRTEVTDTKDIFEVMPWGIGEYSLRENITFYGYACETEDYKNLVNYPKAALTVPYTIPNVNENFVLEVTQAGSGSGYTHRLRMMRPENPGAGTYLPRFGFFGKYLQNASGLNDDFYFKFTVGPSTYVMLIRFYTNNTVDCSGEGFEVEYAEAILVADDEGVRSLNTVISNNGGEVYTDNWQEQEWGSFRGYPRAIGIHQQRLVLGGSLEGKDKLWFSQLGNFYRFMRRHLLQDSEEDISGLNYVGDGPQADDPFDTFVSDNETNPVSWIRSLDDLAVGTLSSEHIITGVDDEALSALTHVPRVQTYEGSAPIQPVGYGRYLLFFNADADKVFEFAVSSQTRRYEAGDLSLFNDTIYQQGFDFDGDKLSEVEFIKGVYSKTRDTAFFITSEGGLVSLTVTGNGKRAWARHKLGGNEPIVKDIALLPNSEGTNDEVYLSVERKVVSNVEGGVRPTTMSTIEKISSVFEYNKLFPVFYESNASIYFDNAKFIQGVSTTNVPYFIQMAGEKVSVMVNGNWHKDCIVNTDGSIDLEYIEDGSEVVIGYDTFFRIKPVSIEVPVRAGQGTGSLKRVHELVLKLYRSHQGFIKSNTKERNIIPYRDYTMAPNEFKLFTGNKVVKVDNTYGIDTEFEVYGNGPYPFTLLNITYKGVAYD